MFAPFPVILPQGVGEKTVFDNLIKYALDNLNFEKNNYILSRGQVTKQQLMSNAIRSGKRIALYSHTTMVGDLQF